LIQQKKKRPFPAQVKRKKKKTTLENARENNYTRNPNTSTATHISIITATSFKWYTLVLQEKPKKSNTRPRLLPKQEKKRIM